MLPTASICHVHTLITHAQPQMVIVKVCRFPAVCPTVFEQGLRLVRVAGIWHKLRGLVRLEMSHALPYLGRCG